MPGQKPRTTVEANLFNWYGLVNKADPNRFRGKAGDRFAMPLATALNIDLDDEGKQTKAAGFSLLDAGSYTSAWATRDGTRCYAVKGTNLVRFWSDGTTDTLWSGIGLGSRMHFLEVAGSVYATNGVQALVLLPDGASRLWGQPVPAAPFFNTFPGTLPAGRYQLAATTVASGVESGLSQPVVVVLDGTQAISISGLAAGMNVYATSTDGDVLYEIVTDVAGAEATWNGPVSALRNPVRVGRWAPPPFGASLPALQSGRLFLGAAIEGQDSSVVWFSQPLGYEHFDLAKDFFVVPGDVRLLAGTKSGLVVGTERRIYSYNEEDGLTELAQYGVVGGQTVYPSPEVEDTEDEPNLVYFWSQQGVCRGLPFENLTAKDVSLPPGYDGAGVIVESGGFSRYAVCVKRDGQARNTY